MNKTTSSIEAFARQNCVSILLRHSRQPTARSRRPPPEGSGSYKCKTCGRTFESFQALGGHRAGHKRITPIGNSGGGSPEKGLTAHECRVCRVRFPTGQALGGHMRRHVHKRKHVDEDGGGEIKKRRVETVSFGSPGMVMRGVLLFDLNLPPVDQESFREINFDRHR